MTASTGRAGTTTGNAATVVELYDAFGRGDVPVFLARLADGVAWEDWRDNWAQRAGIPTMTRRTGPAEVADFFTIVGTWTLHDFSVLDVIGDGSQVVAEVQVEFTLPNGGRFADEEVHLWTFDESGRVIRFRHYLDTAKHIAASHGEDTTTR
jgi:hypothetical protein